MSSKPTYDPSYRGCFVCGKENPEGLRLDFFFDSGTRETVARATFAPAMQGFENIVHGGFVAMLLDEAMAKACIERGVPAMTAKIELRFKKPVLVGEEIEVRGRVIDVKGKMVAAGARCIGASGELKALADGLFIRM